MASMEQECARYAWNKVREVSAKTLGAYKALAKSMPALIMTNGLMQALAFLEGKSEKRRPECGDLLQHIIGWLRNTGVVPVKEADFASVMAWWSSPQCRTLVYQQATEQALNVVRWIRYFADALDTRDKP